MCRGCAPAFLMFATPPLLLVVPFLLPVIFVPLAVIWITSTTCMAAAPLFFLFTPAVFPLVKTSIAIKRQMHRGGGTTSLVMGTAPLLLGLRPSFFPDLELDSAVKRVACPPCRMATPSLFVGGPRCLPLVEIVGAIKRHVRGLNSAPPTGMITAKFLLLGAPTFLPIVVASIAIKVSTSLSGCPATEILFFVRPTLLPILEINLAIEEDRGIRCLAAHPLVVAAPLGFSFGPRFVPCRIVGITIILVATLVRLQATPRFFVVCPSCFPICIIMIAIMQHWHCCCCAPATVMLTAVCHLGRAPLVQEIVQVKLAIILLTSPTGLVTTPLLFALRPAQLPIIETIITIELLRSGGDGAPTPFLCATPMFLRIIPGIFPMVVIRVAIIRVARAACVGTAPPLLIVGPPLPVFKACSTVLRSACCCGMLAPKLLVMAAPALLFRHPHSLPMVQVLLAVVRVTSNTFVHAAPGPILGVKLFKISSAMRRRWSRRGWTRWRRGRWRQCEDRSVLVGVECCTHDAEDVLVMTAPSSFMMRPPVHSGITVRQCELALKWIAGTTPVNAAPCLLVWGPTSLPIDVACITIKGIPVAVAPFADECLASHSIETGPIEECNQ